MMVGQGRNMIDQTVADRETNGRIIISSLNGIAQSEHLDPICLVLLLLTVMSR